MPGDKSAFHMFWWIRHHDRALSRPQDASTASKQETGKNHIAEICSMFPAQECAHIDTVSEASERYGSSDAHGVDKGACEETNDSESSVECGVCSVTGNKVLGKLSSTSTEAIKGVEHALNPLVHIVSEVLRSRTWT